MIRHVVLFFVALSLSLPGFSQHSLTGRIVDEKKEVLGYATVALLNPEDSTLKYFGVTNDKGVYQIKNINTGEYLMQFSFVGMETIFEDINIPSSKGKDLGDKVLFPTTMEEVKVIAEYVPITFRSDTAEFNAKAFTTKPDAVVEELLKKIPGIEVDQAGNLKALGEDVTKVLVDGKEFFGKDHKVATKNLPAKAVEKVQVYDKKSDETEFTGIDDGQRDRTINLLLNEDHKKGYFGNLEAAGGTDERFKLGAKLYRFSDKLQMAGLGMYNNINEFGFSGSSVQQYGEQIQGLNTTAAGGLNLSYNLKGNDRYFISYLGSQTNRDLEKKTSTENFLEQGTYFQESKLLEDYTTTPHKINFGIRETFNGKHHIILNGDINLSSNNNNGFTVTNSGQGDSLINNLKTLANNGANAISVNTNASYIVKLNKDITQIKTQMIAVYTKNSSLLDWNDTIRIYHPDSLSIYHQLQDNNTDRLNLMITPTLVQKISQFWYFNIGVGVGSNKESLSRAQEILQEDGAYIDSLIPPFRTDEFMLNPSLSFSRNTNKSLVFLALSSNWKQFDKILNDSSLRKEEYVFLLPSIRFEYRYRTGRRFNIGYYTNVTMPNVNQLYPVLNTANLVSLYQGNIDLKPSYSHTTQASWWFFDQFSFTSVFLRLMGRYTKDQISTAQITNEELLKITTPVNVPDHYMFASHLNFSTPIRSLGIKIDIGWNEFWTKGLTLVNSVDNLQTNFTHNLNLTLQNRQKEKWDAAIGGSMSITDAKFSIASMNTVYYNTSYFTDIRFTPNDHWSFEAEANVMNYNSESFNEAVSIPLIHARISYYFLKGNKGTVMLSGSDLLNKNIGFYRNSTANYLIEQSWNTIGRYFMLSFSYRIGVK